MSSLALLQSRKNFSPSLDQIRYTILSALPVKYKEFLLNLFNRFLEKGIIPSSWKISLIISLPKANNSGFHSISLLSCALKIFEKIVYLRLQWLVESQAILSQEQMGFRLNRSCTDNLVTLINNIHISFLANEIVAAAFLDVTGAFDNVL